MSKYASVDALQCEIQKLCDNNKIKSDLKRLILRLVSEVPSIEYSAPKAVEHSIKAVSPKKSYPVHKRQPKSDDSIQAIPCSNKIQLEVKFKKTEYGYFAWVCEYGNMKSQSIQSPERCFQTLIRKLRASKIDTSIISTEPIIIGSEENKNVQHCTSTRITK